jgi:hypothetical protein
MASLLGFGAGEQGAEVDGVQEAAFTNPTLVVYEGAVHDRDLRDGAAECLQRDPEPGAGGLARVTGSAWCSAGGWWC